MSGINLNRCWVLAILACTLYAGAAQAVAPLPPADDLARLGEEARERRVPVLIAFMQKTCPYCARARRHLEPLQASADWGPRTLMRELDIDSNAALRDFDGSWTTPRDYARRHGVRRVPTVIVFDDRGRPVADPVVGLTTEDFYSFHVVRALEAGTARVRPAR